MKFAYKMIVLTAMILALSLSIGGTVLIDRNLQRQLDGQIGDAQEDIRLYALTLQALTRSEAENTDAAAAIRSVVLSQNTLNTYDFRISAADGTLITASRDLPFALEPPDCSVRQTRVVSRSGEYWLVTTQTVRISVQTVYLERFREVTDLFRQAQESADRWLVTMLLILLVAVGLTAALTIFLTRPIRRISRTAKQLASGRYEKRVSVRSKDELGQLARDFNHMADSLETQIHALEDAAQRQKDFTASFAHELKTPLTSVIGYADTLRSRSLTQEQRFEAADYIFSEGKRLEAMSLALLDLFALERETPEFRSVSALRLAREIERSCRSLMENQGVLLVLHVEAQEVFCSPELIKTVLYNLLDNARKASSPGGTVELLGAATKSGYRFAVRDHGQGIPAEALHRVTEPFYMVDKSRARASGGAGLGLALCDRIVHLHESSLTFSAPPGEGTTVSFTLGGATK